MSESLVTQVYLRLLKRSAATRCQHIESNGIRCERKAISSHTVQRGGALKFISEDGHVAQIAPNHQANDLSERLKLLRVGIRKASVFPGFCAYHDSGLFSSIEASTGEINEENAALIYYRCICHELYKKENVVSIYGHPDFEKAARKEGVLSLTNLHMNGCRRAIDDLVRAKSHALQLLDSRTERSSLVFKTIEFDEGLPLAFSTAFAPEFDFMGKKILPHEDSDWNSVACACGQIKGKSRLHFCGIDILKGHPIREFFDTLSIVPSNRFGSVALHTAIEFSENTFFRPSWINSLLPEIKMELFKRFGEGTPGEPNSRKRFLASQFDIVGISGTLT